MNANALVTGAAGFIGSNLTLRLIKEGWRVTVIDDLSTGRSDLLEEVDAAGADVNVCSYGDWASKEIIRSVKPDVVFHVAAIPRVAYSIENPLETNMNNVQDTLQLLNWCRGQTGRFVFSSSSSVVGDTSVLPTPTDLKRQPKSPYALQKAVIEDYCRLWSELYDLDTVCLRYFNVFGPHQYGDSPYSTVISAWCNNLVDDKPLRLDGTGEQSRDFCYVDNVVDANILAGEYGDKFCGDIFNIAGGEVRSINDVLDMMRVRVGSTFTLDRCQPRVGDVIKTEADMNRSRELLGYNPKVKFDEGMKRTFEWWGL